MSGVEMVCELENGPVIDDLPTRTIHACRNPQYKMHMGHFGWGGVGWGGVITFMFTDTPTRHATLGSSSLALAHRRHARG